MQPNIFAFLIVFAHAKQYSTPRRSALLSWVGGFSPLTLACQADTPFLRGPPAFPTFLSLLSDSLSSGELSPQLLGKCHTGPCCSRGGVMGDGGVGG